MRPIDADAVCERCRKSGAVCTGSDCEIPTMPTLTPPNEALTLAELREMDGEPVWVHVIDHTIFADKKDDFDGWGMCRKSWVRIWDSKRADIVHIDYDFEDYEKDWIAYRRPPEGEED